MVRFGGGFLRVGLRGLRGLRVEGLMVFRGSRVLGFGVHGLKVFEGQGFRV